MAGAPRDVGIGFVGCGRIGLAVHLRVLASLPGTRVVAVADPDPRARASALSIVPRARATENYPALLEDPAVDAVVLSLPSDLHAQAAIAALDAGKHLYLEKPLATELEGGRAVLDAWRGSGRIGMIGFNYRFNRLYRGVRRALASGRLGRPVAGRSIFSSAPREFVDWKRERRRGGGVLLDLGSHHVDLARFLLEEDVAEVDCTLRSVRTEDDTAALQLRLAGGTIVQSVFSHCTADEDRFEIYCERGKIAADRMRGFGVVVSEGRTERRHSDLLRKGWTSVRNLGYGVEKFRAHGHEPSWSLALRHFVDAVRHGKPASPDLEDGWRSLEVVLAAEEAAREGRRVAPGTSPAPR